MALDKKDREYIENILTKYRDFGPFSALVAEIKRDLSAVNVRINEHLDSEEASHQEFMREIKDINKKIENTPIVNRAVLSGIGLIVVAAIMGFVGLSWNFISNFFKQ